MNFLYKQYGKTLEAAVGNFINNNSVRCNVSVDNSEAYTKGFITMRMMLTYKLKNLIFK